MKSEIYFSEKTFEQLTKAIVAAAEIIAAKKCESDTPPEADALVGWEHDRPEKEV